MSEEERMAKVEADIVHLQKTVEDERQEAREFRKSVENFRQKMDDFRVETANNFGRLREDMAKGFGVVAEKFGAVDKEFGGLRAEIERSRTWMVVTGASLVLTILGTAVALARYLKP